MGDYTAETFVNDAPPSLNDVRLNSLSLAVQNAHTELNTKGRKMSVRAATIANITLSGLQTIDTIALSAGDRVLVKDQTDQRENGIYTASTGAWARATDFNTNEKLRGFQMIFVEAGYYNYHQEFYMAITSGITIGATNITFTRRVFQGIFSVPIYAGGPPPFSTTAPYALGIPGDATGTLFEIGLASTNGQTGTPSKRVFVDLLDYTQFKLVTHVLVAGSANAVIKLQALNPANSTFNDVSTSTSAPLAIATGGLKESPWLYMTAAGVRASSAHLRLVVSGNTVTATNNTMTQLGNTYIMFR